MLEFLKAWAINIVTIVLFIAMIEILLPRGKMKKYVSLLTSTILMIVIINPIIGLFGQKFDFSLSQMSTARNLDKREIENSSKLLEEEQIKQTIELYRNRITEQISQSAREVEGVKNAQADIIINEDYESANFGEIKRVYIMAVVEGSSNNESNEVEDEEANGGNNKGDNRGDNSGDNHECDEEANRGKNKGDNQECDEEANGGNNKGDGQGVANGDNENKGFSLGVSDKDSIEIVRIDKVQSISIGEKTKEDNSCSVFDAELNERLSRRIRDVFGVDIENIVIDQIQR